MPSVWTEERENKHGKTYHVCWKIEVKEPITGKTTGYLRGHEHCGPSKQYAKKREGDIRIELFEGKTPKTRTFGIDLFKLAEIYLAERQGGDPLTFNNWVKPAVGFFKTFRGNCLVNQILRTDFVEWRNKMTSEGLAPSTIAGRLRDALRMFTWAKQFGHITELPVESRKGLLPKIIPTGRYLGFAEIETLFPELPLPLALACYFLGNQGLRKMEFILSADWTKMRTNNIPWKMAVVPIKRGKPRLITISKNVRQMLGEPQVSGPLIPDLTIHMLDHGIREAIDRLAKRGIDLGEITPHDFRHTWATNFMRAYGDLFTLMREGGWRSLTSVQIYQHESKEDNPLGFEQIAHYLPNFRQVHGLQKFEIM